MRYIYLSPHLDDAALCAGGWIYDQTQQGHQFEIWTFMCDFPPNKELSPYAQLIHKSWGIESAEEVVHERRLEDKKSAQILGAKIQHFDFLDCIYRRDKSGNWLYQNIFIDPLPQEADLPQQIADVISARLNPDDKLICQLGIGKHVDHILVRQAAELLNRPLLYLADIPYLFTSPEHLPEKNVGLKEKVETVSETGIHVWGEAVMAYQSQVLALFDSEESMRNQLHGYCLEHKGLRFWTK